MTCKTCAHIRKPGIGNSYCGGRDDLPLAYGANHPLRKLPADGGELCEHYTLSQAHWTGTDWDEHRKATRGRTASGN